MKILIVDELCYPQLGGQQVRFKELAEKWAYWGHDVTITAIDHLGNASKSEIINGVIYNRIITDANYYKSGPFGRKISTILKYTLHLKAYFEREWDLIIFNQFPMLPQLYYKFFHKKRAKTALDFVEHRSSKLWKKINKAILNAADEVICISEHVKSCAGLYRNNNLHVIPSLVDVGSSISKSKTNAIFLGRLENHKHPEHAVQAVISYNKLYNKSLHLNVVGGGSLLSDLKKKYADNDCISFFGSVENAEKSRIVENGRVLILPSEREGLPKVVIEAMAYGIPTITTKYPGNGTCFFVEKEEIGLVALPTIEDLAKKISELETNYDGFVSRCNEIKGNYDLTLNAKKYLHIFQ